MHTNRDVRSLVAAVALAVAAAVAPASLGWAQSHLVDLDTLTFPYSEEGELGHTEYSLEIPESWNKGLVIYIHGYVPKSRYVRENVFPGGQRLLQAALSRGYAIALAGGSRKGFNRREAVLESELLRNYFEKKFGTTWPTIVFGVHGVRPEPGELKP